MPGIVRWIGNAHPGADEWQLQVTGTVAVSSWWYVRINGKQISHQATLGTAAHVCTELTTKINASTIAEFMEILALDGGYGSPPFIGCFSRTAGIPTLISVETTGAGTFTAVQTVAAGGPNYADDLGNYDTGALPVDGDILVFDSGNVDCLYKLDALAAVCLAELRREPGYTGKIGLGETNAAGYREWRPLDFQIGATEVFINGGQRTRLNTGSDQTHVIVASTDGQLDTGVPAFLWHGSHVDNAIEPRGGSSGLAFFGSQTASGGTLKISGSGTSVVCGDEADFARVDISAGSCVMYKAPTAAYVWDTGRLQVDGEDAITTLECFGTFVHNTNGTITTLVLGGELDCSQDHRAKTITDSTFLDGAMIRDPAQCLLFTNASTVPGNVGRISIDRGSGSKILLSA